MSITSNTAAANSAPIPPVLLAVIAAAIHATYGTKLRIVTVAPIQDIDWAREGRRDIFTSHRLR